MPVDDKVGIRTLPPMLQLHCQLAKHLTVDFLGWRIRFA